MCEAAIGGTVHASELHRVRGDTEGGRGWQSVGVRAAGNSRSGAATPVTSVGASANQ